ncbi:hypothetical protein SAMN05216474_1893 [Lishizhenia tianjinensis]|uniref:DUF4340 domain-containing protein n=1 Tax=Lishizhenia tianjinensis TaxID=477690 RepID=A0A1I7A4T4_9FLAO|nr:hypothetical protein [Lishizhenia tianjinensis]SFT69934.1 hypothetical protein SAMN05216474_1893 [Lishizhenia tianjinensis]
MKKKQIIVLLTSVALLAVLGYYTQTALKNEGKSDPTELINFEVENVEEVDKIVIYDPLFNVDFTLVKKDEEWKDGNGNCVQDNPVENILEAFRKISFKGYVNDKLKPTVNKLMAAKAKQVDIYKNGKLVKTWFVGHGTPDHHGTYMLLQTPDIKSDQPVIMDMEGLNGIIEPRFFVDPKQWACSDLFAFEQNNIQGVELVNAQTPEESYNIQLENGDYVARTGEEVLNVNKQNLLSFLNAFDNIHFNQQNYTMNNAQIDSMKRTTPHYSLKITPKKGEVETYNFYDYIDDVPSRPDTNIFSMEYLWTFTKEDNLVRVQIGGRFGIGLGPILIGKDIFVETEN